MKGNVLWLILFVLFLSSQVSASDSFKVSPNTSYSYTLLHGKMGDSEGGFSFLGEGLQVIHVDEGHEFTISSGSLIVHDSSAGPYITVEMSNGSTTIQRNSPIYGQGFFIVSDLGAVRKHLGGYHITPNLSGNNQTTALSLLETSSEIGLYETFDFVQSNGTVLQHLKSIQLFSKNDGVIVYYYQEVSSGSVVIELEFLRVGFDVPPTEVTSIHSKSPVSVVGGLSGIIVFCLKKRNAFHKLTI